MVDQKIISGIFTDFRNLYIGKSDMGILELCRKYENHPMLMGLFFGMEDAVKLNVPQAMKEIYDIYKEYRGRDLEDADWEEIVDRTRQMVKKRESNAWYTRVTLEMVNLLDSDAQERHRIAKEVEKEMEAAAKEMEAA
ncbi:MAG: hypothetical protein ACLU9Q_13770 [Marvinbryantia sp.]|uniref:hypothetical protein n=1 Tax=Marvinbryantia sp. TaxID=2496532 RepID=UPI00399B3FC0